MKRASEIQGLIAHRLRLSGPMSALELRRFLPLSQTQLAHHLRALHPQVQKIGQARNTRYFHTRDIAMVDQEIPIFSINETGVASVFGTLIPVAPRGFYWSSKVEQRSPSRFFDDLPYFLNDLRPAGYLGRMIPRIYPEWSFPVDIRLWDGDAVLRYLTRFGTDLIGNLVIGEIAAHSVAGETSREVSQISEGDEARYYDRLATEVESRGLPGSSAAGEHPKFTARRPGDKTPVLVKFVRNSESPVTARRIDLLHAEALAAEILSDNSETPARVIRGERYTFLEVERFDRVGKTGRRGVISLLSLDAEFLGSGANWSRAARKLFDRGMINQSVLEEIQLREYFGQNIGNTDMHSGNLSFYFEAEEIQALAPNYDMLPMRYAPIQEHLPAETIDPQPLTPRSAAASERAAKLAKEYWRRLQDISEVSAEFRAIAKRNTTELETSLRKYVVGRDDNLVK